MIKINFENIEELDFFTDEAFKSLRTNIQFSGEDMKVITFTSCQPNEGKTDVVFNLSNAMAQSGKKVLFIDADMRKSVFISRYRVDKRVSGLTEFLVGKCQLMDVVCATNIPNMHIILTGPTAPNPSELLGSVKFKRMLEELRKVYDYIFIDCPPLGTVIDAAVASKYSDGAVMIVESENVSYRFAQRVKKQLEQSGVNIIGVILNKIKMVGKKGYGKYGYNKYYGKQYSYKYQSDDK